MSFVRALMESREDWLEHLVSHYKIDVAWDGDLVSLKYDEEKSLMDEPIVGECRGMVVDARRRQIKAWPYNKFWNHGDPRAAAIDWSTAVVQEKADGALMILWWSDVEDTWLVSSSGTPRARGSFAGGKTYEQAFWETFKALRMYMPGYADVCYMFELCVPQGRIVVAHDRPKLILHGARIIDTGEEMGWAMLDAMANRFGWSVIGVHEIRSIEECLERVAMLDPMVQEGYVVVDGDFNRVKIKSPRYEALHAFQGDVTRRAIDLWRGGVAAESFFDDYPEMRRLMDPTFARLDRAADMAWTSYERHREAPTRKDFALAVKDLPYGPTVLRLYSASPNASAAPATPEVAREIMRGQTAAALERMLEAIP